jgi:hypothetical protein
LPPRHLWRFCVCIALASRFAVAHTDLSQLPDLPGPTTIEMVPEEPSSWFDNFWKISILRFFAPANVPFPQIEIEEPADTPFSQAQPERVSPNCPVDPLPVIDDPEALEFEGRMGTSAIIDLEGLTQSTALALEGFQRIISSAGGTVAITSAYRPSAYQEHLQAVWDKWMLELRRNRTEDCSALRAQVEAEFNDHQLLVTQRPVPVSDHTLGIAFDAAVNLPGRARSKRRRFSLDSLAKKAGFSRPDVRRDPVHFRLIGGRVLGT